MLSLILVLSITLSLSPIQTYLASLLTQDLKEHFGVDIKIEKVDLSVFGKIALNDILIEDEKSDSLLYINSFRANLSRFDLSKNQFFINDIFLVNSKLNIRKYKGEEKNNVDNFIDKFGKSEKKRESKFNFDLESNGLNVKNFDFSFENKNKEAQYNVEINDFDLVMNRISVSDSLIKFVVDECKFNEHHGLYLDEFKGDFKFTPNKTLIENFNLKTKESELNLSADINYKNYQELLKEFKIQNFDFNIDKSMISMKELNMIIPLNSSNEVISIKTEIVGDSTNLNLKNLVLNTSDNSVIDLSANLYQYRNNKSFKHKLNIHKISSNYFELKQLLPAEFAELIPVNIANLGNFDLNGTVVLDPKELNTELYFNSQIGVLTNELQIIIADSLENSHYKGKLVVDNLDLGKLLENQSLGESTMNVDLDGKGFSLENLNAMVKGEVSKFTLNNYSYKNLTVSGNVRDKYFDGRIDLKDDNAVFNFIGSVNLREKLPKYNFNLYIDKADLVKTNLFTRDSIAFLEGSIDINAKGSNAEDIQGVISMKNIVYQNENDLYYFENFDIKSENKNKKHHITLNSDDVISGKINGEFKFIELPNVFKNTFGGMFKNYKAKKVSPNQNIAFDFNFKNKIIEIFYPDVFIKSGTSLSGNLDASIDEIKLKFNSPGIRFGDVRMDSINLWVDNKNPFFNTLLDVAKIDNPSYPIEKLNLVVVNKIDSLYLNSNFTGGDSVKESYSLNAYQTFDNNSNLVFGFLNSKIDYLGNEFFVNQDNNFNNKIIYNLDNGNLLVDSLKISHGSEYLLVHSKKVGKKQEYIVDIENVKIGKLIPQNSKFSSSGNLNGIVFVNLNNGKINPKIDLHLDSLVLNNEFKGDLDIHMESTDKAKEFDSNIKLNRYGINTLLSKGKVKLDGSKSKFDLKVNLYDFNIDFINPLTENIFNNIKGRASGEIDITGPLSDPDLNGYLDLSQAGIGINYLNVYYNFDSRKRVRVKDHIIYIPEVTMIEKSSSTKGIISGTIKNYSNYKYWDLDLKAKANNLMVLNTEENDNPLYYGQVFTSGDISIVGPTSSLQFTVKAKTEKGTTLSVPLENNKVADESNFIHFVKPKEDLSQADLRYYNKKQNEEDLSTFERDLLKGLKLSFNLEVTTDALMELVFDEKVGDVMKGRGSGNLVLDIDTKGEFSIYGKYKIVDGEYLFTMQNLVNKKFNVKSGGTISWNGGPLAAELDLDATYRTKTQVANYLNYSSNNSYNKMLVELILHLNGPLLKPDIGFDIKLPDAEASLQSQLAMKLNENQEERGRQFIMLITLNTFATSTNDIELGGSVASSTAELLANQFSNIASGISDNFDVNLGYTTANAINQNSNDLRANNDELEVGLSTQVFDDRVTVNGNVGVPVGSSQSSIVGDVEVLVNITKDGRYKGKVFSRQNVVTDLFDTNGYTQGIGISYQTDYDTFSEFLRNLFRKREMEKAEKKKQEGLEVQSDTTTVKFK